MSFVFGTALLVAAIFLLGVARYAVTRFEETAWIRRFAATEIMALLVTCISALGLALLGAGLVSSDGLGIIELGASLAVIGLSIVAVVRIFRAADRRASAASAVANPAARPIT
jgi:hypothetical protein